MEMKLSVFLSRTWLRLYECIPEDIFAGKPSRNLQRDQYLGSLVSLVIMKRGVLLQFQLPHLELTLDGFEDVDRELQRNEVAIHLVSS